MQSNAVAGRQVSCVRISYCVCAYAYVLVCGVCTAWQHVCRLFIGLSLLGLACVCAGTVWLTLYINLIYYIGHFLSSLLTIPLRFELLAKAGCALINLLGLVCHAVEFAVFSASYGHRATYLHIIQAREFILNGIHESIQQLLNDYHVRLKNRLLNVFTEWFIHFNQCHASRIHSSY